MKFHSAQKSPKKKKEKNRRFTKHKEKVTPPPGPCQNPDFFFCDHTMM